VGNGSTSTSITPSVFDWEDYLSLARRLATESDEAARRSTISRAYYAVYHAASDYVRSRTLVPSTRRLNHRLVWEILINDQDADRSMVGRRGRVLRDVRVDADYRARFPGNLARKSRDAVAEAQALLDLIDALP